MSGNKAPAGWYPDPGTINRNRYWDGGNWTRESIPVNTTYTKSVKEQSHISGAQSELGAIQEGFIKIFDYSGRASLANFWLWTLLFVLPIVLLTPVLLALMEGTSNYESLLYIYILVILALIPTTISYTARRLRDAGYSPWWLLVVGIPVIGGLILLIQLLQPSKP